MVIVGMRLTLDLVIGVIDIANDDYYDSSIPLFGVHSTPVTCINH